MTNVARSPLFIVHVPGEINSIGITKDAGLITAFSNKLSVCGLRFSLSRMSDRPL